MFCFKWQDRSNLRQSWSEQVEINQFGLLEIQETQTAQMLLKLNNQMMQISRWVSKDQPQSPFLSEISPYSRRKGQNLIRIIAAYVNKKTICRSIWSFCRGGMAQSDTDYMIDAKLNKRTCCKLILHLYLRNFGFVNCLLRLISCKNS